jgi:uncharacterized protein (DUF2062 family)
MESIAGVIFGLMFFATIHFSMKADDEKKHREKIERELEKELNSHRKK